MSDTVLKNSYTLSTGLDFNKTRVFWNENDRGQISEFQLIDDDARSNPKYKFSGGACYSDWPVGENSDSNWHELAKAEYAVSVLLGCGFSNDGVARQFVRALLSSRGLPESIDLMIRGWCDGRGLFFGDKEEDTGGGMIVAVVGPTGCGKTYWINKFADLMRAGDVKVEIRYEFSDGDSLEPNPDGTVFIESLPSSSSS